MFNELTTPKINLSEKHGPRHSLHKTTRLSFFQSEEKANNFHNFSILSTRSDTKTTANPTTSNSPPSRLIDRKRKRHTRPLAARREPRPRVSALNDIVADSSPGAPRDLLSVLLLPIQNVQ
ncbi:hypothetical protein BU24DRAFT_111145 [Aaosphaeria arxii CBS 175.79]|uniref:Uncharacterized protein n=1 Tax=Aaosphaeria arxii CBS 175.79 TaxID=1450172 RepID=A0A6A5Y2I9_9PLEO|nr:uncharacterized protein BU24DRAFT_111145 [Aaosphaeria arxii CBS 175.79]KAF2019040.1 hypothetical protein BU24DRAFT_111145 [Aaosphaeria arxii CBS 175.79]